MLLKNVILLEYYCYETNFGARNERLSFTFLLFLWGSASQKLRISSRFAKCEPLIRTLRSCKPEACNFIKKVLAKVFFSEFCEIFKNTFFAEHLRMTASDVLMQVVVIQSRFKLRLFGLFFAFFRN